MAVGLYTSRLVLEALGVVDYGLYGLVGGIVSMFAFLNSSMSAATQRYLSFDIGKGDDQRLQQTFNASLNIHILIGFIIVLLAETVGLWFVNYKLDIPAERMSAANWVYQFSILAFFFQVIQVPYNALLIARERMSVYAYMSIVEVLLKLVIVFVLLAYQKDRLILYAILTFSVSFTIRMLYQWYCRKHFVEARYKFYYDKNYYRELLSFSGWSLFGNIAGIARAQGGNILLNLFFGPVANAGYSIAVLVQGVIGNFVSNFQVALNPQITQNYAKGNTKTSLNLIFKSSKFSFFVMFILVVPLMMNMEYVLNLWLKEVPDYTLIFLQWTMIYALIETISNPLIVGAQATGKIKWYQIIIGSFIMLIMPIVWILYKNGYSAEALFYVLIINSFVALIFRLGFLSKMMDLSIVKYFKQVLLRVLIVSGLIYLILNLFTIRSAENIFELIYQSFGIGLITMFLVWMIGFTKGERLFIWNLFQTKFLKK